jgi:hypothetical protein
MFDRFWQQYPQGSIVSDLVQIHGEHYVVRVSLSSAQQVLVTTLAADLDLVIAEQRATTKALEILGISARQESLAPIGIESNIIESGTPTAPNSLIPVHAPEPDQPSAAKIPKAAVTEVSSKSIEKNIEKNTEKITEKLTEPIGNLTVTPLPDLPVTMTTNNLPAAIIESLPAESASSESNISDAEYSTEIDNQPAFMAPEPAIDSSVRNGKTAAPDIIEPPITTKSQAITEVTIPEPAAKSSKAKKATTEPTPEVIPEPTVQPQSPVAENLEQNPAPETDLGTGTPPEIPLSVTDMIPLINMELKRLGWSKERGRDYMVSLYNKRASALLSDEELFGLLQHLKAEQIVPSGS